jgi:hypothetical protein
VETTPERVVVSEGTTVEILTGKMEHHISADIAYAVWQYWRATGDDDFFLSAGAEILLDTARFWASRAVAEEDGGRHIRHVIGPDPHSRLVVGTAISATVAAAIGAPVHAGRPVDATAAVVAAIAAPAVTAIAVTRGIAVIACGRASGIGAIARGAPVTARAFFIGVR